MADQKQPWDDPTAPPHRRLAAWWEFAPGVGLQYRLGADRDGPFCALSWTCLRPGVCELTYRAATTGAAVDGALAAFVLLTQVATRSLQPNPRSTMAEFTSRQRDEESQRAAALRQAEQAGHEVSPGKEMCCHCELGLSQVSRLAEAGFAVPPCPRHPRDWAVDHPAHYGGAANPYEAIKVIEAWRLGFLLGNTVKYLARAGKKDLTTELEDLKKAAWYLARRIAQLEGRR